MKLAELYVEIRANTAKFQAGLRGVRSSLKRVNASMDAVAVKARRVFLGVGLAVGYSVVQTVKFEKQMARVSVMLSETDMQYMKPFTKGVKEMSVAFGQSTKVLTDGLYDLLSATFAPAEVMKMLGTASRQAVGGVTDAGIAVKGLVSIMNAYNIEAKDSMKVSDKMFATVKRGVLTFEELSTNIGKAGTSAAIAQVPLEELLASISTSTRAGLNPYQAITAIVGMLRSFLKPSKEAAEAAKELGFEMSTATIKSEGLVGVFGRIKDLSADDLAKLFPNIRGLKAVAAAVLNLGKFQEDLNLIQNAGGRTMEAFNKMADTQAFKLAQMKEEMVAVAREIGDGFIPVLRDLLLITKDIIDKFKRLSPENKQLIADILKLTLAFSGLLMILPRLLLPLTTLISTLLFFAAHPIIAGIVAIGVALGQLTGVFKRVGEVASQTFSGIQDALATGDIQLAIDILWAGIKLAWYEGTNDLQVGWAKFTTTIEAGFEKMGYNIEVAWEKTIRFLKKSWRDWEAFHKKSSVEAGGVVKKASAWQDFFTGGFGITQPFVNPFDEDFLNTGSLNKKLSGIDKVNNKKLASVDAGYNAIENAEKLLHDVTLQLMDARHQKAMSDIGVENQTKLNSIKSTLEAARADLFSKTAIAAWKSADYSFITDPIVAGFKDAFGIVKEKSKKWLGLDFFKSLLIGDGKKKDAGAAGGGGVPSPQIKGGTSVGIQEIWTKIQQSALGGTTAEKQQKDIAEIKVANKKQVEVLEQIREKVGGPALAAP